MWRIGSFFALLTVVFGVSGCGGFSEPKTHQEQSKLVSSAQLQMHTSVQKLLAGQSVTLRCDLLQSINHASAPDARIHMSITPAAPAQIVSANEVIYTPLVAGEYTLGCQSDDPRVSASAPQSITVLPAEPTGLVLKLDKSRTEAGQSVHAECLAQDAYGNPIHVPNAQLWGPPGIDIQNHSVGSVLSGTYGISCTAPEWPQLPASPPVPLSVNPGEARSVKTWLKSSWVRANTPVTVKCEARDAFGNPVPFAASDFWVTGEVQSRNADGFVAQHVGQYRVGCFLPHASGQWDAEGVQVSVVAGEPAKWEVQLHRQGRCFTQGRLPLVWRVLDAWGNEVEDAQVELTVAPESNITRDASGGYLFLDEGEYDITLRVISPAPNDLPPWHEHILVDSTPPHLEITSPMRGAMIESDNPEHMIQGRIVDNASRLIRVVVDGQEQVLPSTSDARSFDFAVARQSTWGLNIIEATAEDACGNVAILKQSYLHSGAYAPAATAPDPNARISQGLRVHLTQQLWDDADRSTNDDVATLLQSVLNNIPLDERLPHHLLAYPDVNGNAQLQEESYNCLFYTKSQKTGVEVTRNGPLQYDPPEVEYVRPVEGAWHVGLVFRNLRVPMKITYYNGKMCLGSLSPSIDAVMSTREARIEATAQITNPEDPLQPPTVSLCPTCIRVNLDAEEPNLQVDWKLASAYGMGHMLDVWLNWLLAGYRENMTEALQGKIRHELSAGLEGFLQGLRLEHSLPLTAPWRGSIQVASGLDFASLKGPEGAGSGELGLYTQFYSRDMQLYSPRAEVQLSDTVRGSILRDPTARLNLEPEQGQSFALAIHDDLLNQALWALWYGGAFTHRDLKQIITSSSDPEESSLLDAATLRLFFLLPPVIMPGDNPGEIKLAVGDAYVDADCDLYRMFRVASPGGAPRMQAGFYFSTILTARIDIDPDEGHLIVKSVGVPEMHVQAAHISNPTFQPVVTHWLERALNRSIPPLLERTLGSFPLPVLQINRMSGIASEAVWRLHDTQLSRPAHSAETIFKGSIHESIQKEIP